MDYATLSIALANGVYDEYLDALADTISSRRNVVATRAAMDLKPGDTFVIQNISPKYMSGERVEFIEHTEGWLRCKVLGHTSGKFGPGSKILLRYSHVKPGTVRSA